MSETILSQKPIEKEKRQANEWSFAKMIYTGLMAFNLLSFLWLYIFDSGIEMPPIIWSTRLIAAILAFFLGKLWKDRGFQILSIYFFLFFFRCFIPDPNNLFHKEASESVLSALWLFSACYGIGRILDKKQLVKLIKPISVIWIFAIAICCGVALYAALTGNRIEGLKGVSDSFFYGYYDKNTWSARLYVGYSPTISSAILCITALISIITFCLIRQKLMKICIFVATCIIILAMALTETRTAYISLAIGLTIYIWVMVLHKKRYKCTKKTIIVSIVCMLLVFAIILLLINSITPVYNFILTRSIISQALAETVENTKVPNVHRGFDLSSTYVLSGRYELWRDAIAYITSHKLTLLIGESKIAPLSAFNNGMSHCHSIYIQILLESGIPGLVLFLLFIFSTGINSVKAVFSADQPLWIKLLPVIVISLLAGDLVECYLWLRASQCIMASVFFICCGILNQVSTKSKSLLPLQKLTKKALSE